MWALLLLVSCGGTTEKPAAASTSPPTPVKVLTIGSGAAIETVDATGVIEAVDTVLLQPEAAGVVASVLFADGTPVQKGQRLVQLRDADARAAVAEANARLGLAEIALQRNEALFANNNASQAAVDQARAERELARAQLDRAKEALRRTVIVAPFDGVTGRREVAPGQVVATTTPITRIDALDPVTVDITLPEAALAEVKEGQRASVTVAAFPDRRFEGELVYLAPRLSPNARTVAARVRVPNPDQLLRPGLTASVTLTTATVDNAVTIPTYAVIQSATGASAWVVDAENKAQPRKLTLGDRQADSIRVIAGLAPGDQLVIEGYTRLRPGAAVEVQTGAAP